MLENEATTQETRLAKTTSEGASAIQHNWYSRKGLACSIGVLCSKPHWAKAISLGAAVQDVELGTCVHICVCLNTATEHTHPSQPLSCSV